MRTNLSQPPCQALSAWPTSENLFCVRRNAMIYWSILLNTCFLFQAIVPDTPLDENALRGHKSATEGQNGMFASLNELAPETLPTLDRQLQKLCEDHKDFLSTVGSLREEAQNALQAFQPRLDKPGSSGPHFSKPSSPASVPDFGAIRQQGMQLVEALRTHQKNETKLLLETA